MRLQLALYRRLADVGDRRGRQLLLRPVQALLEVPDHVAGGPAAREAPAPRNHMICAPRS